MKLVDSIAIRFFLLGCFACALVLESVDAQSRRRNSAEEILTKSLLEQGDKNSDGSLTVDEWNLVIKQWYDRLDTGGSGRLNREEFLLRMPPLLAGSGAMSKRTRSMIPSKFLEFFVALDTDRNGSLEKGEFESITRHWFQSWSKGVIPRNLNEGRLVSGFQDVFPKTNMSGASIVSSQDPIPGLPKPPPSSVLTPGDSIKSVQMVDGFELQLAASEPMIQDPVALSFDENGNLYVVEMRSFMLDIDRSGELDPICRISILKDTDGDGFMDKSRVFLDKLMVPRAVLATHGGILFVEDYQLYFAKDTDGDDQADVRVLMDADYGRSNIEHAPNGLMRAMDNWIYNGRSPWRYRWIRGQLVKERTEIRGQWGMTQDQTGRLFYNVNNSQLLGDFTPPNYMGRNENYPSTAGLNLFVATDQRVYTVRMNTAVNRGYLPDVLDDSGRLHVFASSCSPVIYRGDQYGDAFVGNAFVCDPAANIIKRNYIFETGMTLSAKQSYEGFEFLASNDERFRPVNLHAGPDGCLWVLDMYRGIAQYGMFMTDYLRRETLERNLHHGIHYGRLFRIVNEKKRVREPLDLPSLSNKDLVGNLAHQDGWIRDTAQRMIVESGDHTLIPELLSFAQNSINPLGTIHALWSIEGILIELKISAGSLGKVGTVITVHTAKDFETPFLTQEIWTACFKFLSHSDTKVQIAALRVCESLSRGHQNYQTELLSELEKLSDTFSKPVLFQSVLTAGNLSLPQALPFMAKVASDHCNEWLIREALMSGLQDWEMTFLQILLNRPDWQDASPGRILMLQSLAKAVAAEGGESSFGLFLGAMEHQSKDVHWRAENLLRGLLEYLQFGSDGSITCSSKPSVWESLKNHESSSIRDQMVKMENYVTWPGHPLFAPKNQQENVTQYTGQEARLLEKGKMLFQQICAGCHGSNGEGLKAQAPPLQKSEWVSGSPERIVRILLHGMQGPLNVSGKRYTTPEILSEMPPLSVLEDSHLSIILNYIRSEWGERADWINPDDVKRIRQSTAGREIPWNEHELLEIP